MSDGSKEPDSGRMKGQGCSTADVTTAILRGRLWISCALRHRALQAVHVFRGPGNRRYGLLCGLVRLSRKLCNGQSIGAVHLAC